MTKDLTSNDLKSIGLMSGTSMDGIDAAFLLTDGEKSIKKIADYSLAYNAQFKFLLKACERAVWESAGDLNKARQSYPEILKRLSMEQSIEKYENVSFDQVIERSTDLHIEATKNLLKKTNYKAQDIDVIGYHGQTLFHRPSAKITIQAGDGQKLANETGIVVVYDFRSNDVKHGGQGAPLAPLYHQAIAKQKGFTPSVIANCGGITNVTIVGEKEEDLSAYDCGPGNTLIDRFVQLKTGKNMDKGGAFGAKGNINQDVLQLLKEKAIQQKQNGNYLEKKPPKSLDVNDIVLIPEVQALNLEDGCATLEAFTAECIVSSLASAQYPVPQTWILSGGGWKNKTIYRELQIRLQKKLGNDIKLLHADQAGWSSQFMEAEFFAYLAVRSLRNLPISLPGTTGVPSPLIGGKVAKPII